MNYHSIILKEYIHKKNGYITIDTVDLIDYRIEKKGIKNLKLENHFIKNTNELVEYLNTHIEYFKIQEGFNEEENIKILEQKLKELEK